MTRMMGSSPRRRGAERVGLITRRSPGFIPTQAGSRSWSPGISVRSWVHPHAGGEQPGVQVGAGRGEGSSPRRRGAVQS